MFYRITLYPNRNTCKSKETEGDFSIMYDPQYISDHCVSCGNCVSKCIMLQHYATDPKAYFKDYAASPADQRGGMIAYYCMMCGLCKTVCPQKLDLGQGFLAIRNDIIRENGGKTTIKALRAVNMHQKLSFCGLFTALDRGGS